MIWTSENQRDQTEEKCFEFTNRLESDPTWRDARYNEYLGLNQQAWQAGLSKAQLKNETHVRQTVDLLDSRFHLVLITELLTESLVLLAHLLCIPLISVASLSKNVRQEASRVSKLFGRI